MDFDKAKNSNFAFENQSWIFPGKFPQTEADTNPENNYRRIDAHLRSGSRIRDVINILWSFRGRRALSCSCKQNSNQSNSNQLAQNNQHRTIHNPTHGKCPQWWPWDRASTRGRWNCTSHPSGTWTRPRRRGHVSWTSPPWGNCVWIASGAFGPRAPHRQTKRACRPRGTPSGEWAPDNSASRHWHRPNGTGLWTCSSRVQQKSTAEKRWKKPTKVPFSMAIGKQSWKWILKIYLIIFQHE